MNRSFFTRSILVLIIFILVGMTLTACSTSDDNNEVDNENVILSEKIVRITAANTPIIDPCMAIDDADSIGVLNLYDSLVFPSHETKEPVPLLAEKWDISDDGMDYVFYLKRGAKFHNGKEVTASDVVFSANRLLTMGEGFAYLFTDIVEEVTVEDDYKVKFSLKKPYPIFLQTLCRLYILNEEQVMENLNPSGSYGEFGDYGREWLQTNDAGSGPYMLSEIVQQEYLYAVKFDEWNGGSWDPDAPDGFKIIDTTEPTTVRVMMANRELEITDKWQPTENIDAISKLPGIEVALFSTLANQSMFYNTKKPPTDDVNFRKALSCLFDYDMIIEKVFPGSPRSYGPVPSDITGHVKTNQYHYDLEAAKEYLSKSKYADELSNYPVEILCNSDVPDHEKVALALQFAAKQVGITVVIDKAPWISIVDRMSNIESTPNLLSMSLDAQVNDAGSMLETRYSTKTSGTIENGEWLLDKELDLRIEDAILTLDEESRFEKYAELQHMIVEDMCPTAWLADILSRVAYQSEYMYWPVAEASKEGNYISNLYGYHFYFHDMRIYPDKKLNK